MPKLLSTERLPKTLILLLVMSILSLGIIKSASYIYWNAPLRSVLAAIKYEEYRQYQGIAADAVAYKTVEKITKPDRYTFLSDIKMTRDLIIATFTIYSSPPPNLSAHTTTTRCAYRYFTATDL